MPGKKAMHAGKTNILSALAVVLAGFVLIGWADNREQIRKEAEKVETIRADFVQEKHLKILSKPLVSKGHFYYQVPGSLRWEYESPIQSILLMHNGRIRRYIKRDNSLTEDAGARLQAMQVVLREIISWLNGRFDNNPDFDSVLKTGRKIVLIPTKQSLSKFIKRIELMLSNRPGIIESVMIYESEDSFTKIEFKNVEINKGIEESIFREP
ncbi:MAG: outer membrane lipoprotein carrier protein LolA [Thermodesulfobacteriota bacterium]|nr:outer membrane lipoprotein carrier protein LolA [Thermodesulfobacteriota bacterium]